VFATLVLDNTGTRCAFEYPALRQQTSRQQRTRSTYEVPVGLPSACLKDVQTTTTPLLAALQPFAPLSKNKVLDFGKESQSKSR
jgi:hypothetical protein